MRRNNLKWLPLLAALAMAGCAKFPDAGGGSASTRLIFDLYFDGEINPNYIYFVALNPTTEDPPTTVGPIPVIAPPWGNGFTAGDATHFVRWSSDQSPRYQVYQFLTADLLNFRPIGVPVAYTDPGAASKVLHFELNLSQIAPAGVAPEDLRTLQLNIYSQDRVPVGGAGSKNWDALGDGRLGSQINSPINIPLKVAAIYTNSRFLDLEPQGDQADPRLDLVDFRIEVRPQ